MYEVHVSLQVFVSLIFNNILLIFIAGISKSHSQQVGLLESPVNNKEMNTDSQKKQEVELQQTCVVMNQNNKDSSVMSHECDSVSQLLPNNSTENRQASRLPIMQTKEEVGTDSTEANKECSESFSLLNDNKMSTDEGPDADNVFNQDCNNKDSQKTNQAVPTSETFGKYFVSPTDLFC